MQKIYKIGYAVFVIVIIAIAILFIITLFPVKGNIQVKIVQSGSMEPVIRTGSLVLIKPQSNYQVGEIVTFGKDTKVDVPTTHRIIDSRAVNGNLLFTTKGDANEDKDVEEVKAKDIIGKVLFSLPFVGYLIDFAKKPIGFFLLIGIPALYIITDELYKMIKEIKKIKKKKEKESKEKNLEKNIE